MGTEPAPRVVAVLQVALILLTFLGQRVLGVPAAPRWAGELLLPMVWLVGPAMTERAWRHALPGLWIGLLWDLVLEPVIGPGAIAWSAAGLAVRALASVLADRSARAWFVFGALGVVLVAPTRALVELPLGIITPIGWGHLLRSSIFTATWCGLVGWFLGLDLPSRLRRYRARRLR
jgi:hypothetical protein